MKTVLFLDFDGVLNSTKWFLESRKGRMASLTSEQHQAEMIDPASVAELNHILAETGCEVVISSTWRRGNTMGALLRLLVARGMDKAHWDKFIGYTPVLDGQAPSGLFTAVQRGYEIQAWLDRHPEMIERIAILDDDGDMAHLKHRLVLTNGNEGLTREKADEVVAMLT